MHLFSRIKRRELLAILLWTNCEVPISQVLVHPKVRLPYWGYILRLCLLTMSRNVYMCCYISHQEVTVTKEKHHLQVPNVPTLAIWKFFCWWRRLLHSLCPSVRTTPWHSLNLLICKMLTSSSHIWIAMWTQQANINNKKKATFSMNMVARCTMIQYILWDNVHCETIYVPS